MLVVMDICSHLILLLSHNVNDWVDPDRGPVEHIGNHMHRRVLVAFVKDLIREIQSRLDLVQLCETQMFKFVLYGNIIFDTLEQSSFKKYATCWVFLALRHTLYLCICICVFARLTHESIIFDTLEQSSFQN